MTSPRRQLVDPEQPGYFHCVSRCVRRAFLCGADRYSGRSFEHRRQWIEDRLLELADVFAVGLYAYAVMANHVHVVLHVDPGFARQWSDLEVAERWVRLFPVRENGTVDTEGCAQRRDVIAGDPVRVARYRERLASLSWFMRCLNEPIARRANREDGCTGRFWEGRFKCQALLDRAAVLACMAYVDLNPVRAGLAEGLEDSGHTSVRRRLEGDAQDGEELQPLAGSAAPASIGLATAEYLALVDWTGRIARPDKRGRVTGPPPRALGALAGNPLQWRCQVLGIESRYWRAVGAVDALLEKAAAIGQCWLKGQGVGRRIERMVRVGGQVPT